MNTLESLAQYFQIITVDNAKNAVMEKENNSIVIPPSEKKEYDYGEYMEKITEMKNDQKTLIKYVKDEKKKILNNVKNCVQLAFTLNHLSWKAKNKADMDLFAQLYNSVNEYFLDNLGDEEVDEYWKALD